MAAKRKSSMGNRLSRRLLVLRTVALGGGGTALTSCAPPPAHAPRVTGITDTDSRDAPGNGRGYQCGVGISDNDSSDAPCHGRGSYRGPTDSDPYDAAGNGRYYHGI